ncbi:exonuclease III [Pseudoalteromonas sp. YIC-656]|uniref:exonuclease III n=1 Tax=Pseudoalteromonas pernae TaxID=3118054 RepID=UPI003242064F
MFKFATVLLPVVFASTAIASTGNQYFAKNDSVESQLCATAANSGLMAAKVEGQKHGIKISRISSSLYCNGQDIRDIAKKVEVVKVVEQGPTVNLYAKNTAHDTKLCIAAAEKGLARLAFHGKRVSDLKCNGQPVEKFVEQYGQSAK